MAELKSYRTEINDTNNTRNGAVSPSDPVIEMNGHTKKDKGGSDKKGDGDKKKEYQEMVSVFEVFKYATCFDKFCMILGTICGCIHGAAFPVMIIVFGEMINLFVTTGSIDDIVELLKSCGGLVALNVTGEDILNDPSLLYSNKDFIREYTTANCSSVVDLDATNNDLQTKLLDTMQEYAIYFIIIGCSVIVLGYGQVMFWMIASEKQTHLIRERFYRNIMRQNIGWFDLHESGELNSRITNDISKIHDGIGDKMGQFFQWFSGFIAGVVIGFVYGWKLTLVILAISPALAAAAFLMTKLVGMASGAELKAYAQAGAIAEEVLGSIRTVLAFGGQAKESIRYESRLSEAHDMGVRKGFVSGISTGVVWLIIFCAYALGFWYGAQLSRDEKDVYNIGNVMIVFFSVIIGAFSLGNAAPPMQSLAVARGAAFVVYSLIEQVPPIDSASPAGKKLDKFEGTIRLTNVHFNYPSRPDVKVLRGVDLEICRGQTVALVGASGCGKSTIVQLLQRFYDPEQGSIFVDGVNVKDLNLKWLREHIGIVSQEPVLFGNTIGENIRFGNLNVTQEGIERAAKEANAHDFILQLPDKYETLVGERGAQLSGGQKQRIAIARALVRDPKILLLDEATSALDMESEGVVQEALEKASHGRTTVVIAHRLSTIKNADMIASFQDGRIVEKGTHNELMEKEGIYYQLVTRQSTVSEDDLDVEMFEKPEVDLVHSPVKRALSNPGSTGPASPDETTEEAKKEKVNAGFGRIMRLNAPEWFFILLGCLSALINGGLMPAFAIIFAEILGVFQLVDEDEQEKKITMYCLLFVGIGLLSLVTYFLQGYMFGRSGEALTLRLRSIVFKTMLKQEMAFFDDHENNVGALCTRLSTDASQIQGMAGVRLGTTILSLGSILAGLIIAFIISWKLTLLIIAFLPLLMVGGMLQMKMLTGAAGKNKEALESAGKVAIESIENIRTVASLTREGMFLDKFMHELNGPFRDALKKAHVVGIAFSFSQGVIFFCYAASFWLGAYLVEQKELDYVQVFKAFSAVVFGGMAIGQASAMAPDAAKAQVSAEQVFKLLDRKLAIGDEEERKNAKTPEGKFSSTVSFKNVKFRYPTRPDIVVLNGLDLEVEPGQTVALVGSSGCGKSTTVQLTERFYDTESGEVMLDQYNVRDLDLAWLRGQIGIVSQEPVLFDLSIAENIAYGDNTRQIPMDEIIQAARSANIHDFISSLPDGYDTNVGEKGAQLSGGQKQRVAIARALVRNPKILLLDEATSALDTESEKVVQDALDRAREGRTCIVIAHRLSTIQNADKICVIRHGVVTEQGRHSELMKQQGFYYKLNMVQARTK
ncbi:ATP-dependent translocase ABCB1-like isoform X1 [Mya arenaria]|uniref:ATP-dependent translocase ABCB1-like isoform X1 n=1 Tax=Mya arenaria TaxID=6604 RepID=UPI0022E70165|nr:ATP-dependent translocase ABCB1-like isoform X1 [Mya arenaria]XP_052792992.1 ATP-dependent translocase ABCB1-like isoform X1 [Mya arenaria]